MLSIKGSRLVSIEAIIGHETPVKARWRWLVLVLYRAKRASRRDIPQRLARCVAMWCDAQRRVVERCDTPRRAALPAVMLIPTRPID